MPDSSQLGWAVLAFYLLPIATVPMVVRRQRESRGERPWHLIAAYLMSVPVSLAIGLATARYAVWLCNCGSYQTGDGNNHFDEDVMVAHILSMPLLGTAFVQTCNYARRGGSLPALLGHILIALAVAAFLWAAGVSWIPPGC